METPPTTDFQLHFLCANHREWVSENPEQSRQFVADTKRKGQRMLRQLRWHDAIPYWGCIFETAEILDDCSVEPSAEVLSLLCQAARALSRCFTELDAQDMAYVVISQARRRIEAIAFTYELQAVPCWIVDCLDLLKTEWAPSAKFSPAGAFAAHPTLH
ncbi:hypothetical protein K0504_06190 [Neiella marina]|uniref:Uncharacterized protein n=1 Tax=Neiella holothuriorum TaxID=2870530 RepID=A0ABS7EE57_9GAMM|nr:hypothetical protein [Neiella holothuriorum]MBW8190622.1 hypothetical protein [Neiella holothuriorum]